MHDDVNCCLFTIPCALWSWSSAEKISKATPTVSTGLDWLQQTDWTFFSFPSDGWPSSNHFTALDRELLCCCYSDNNNSCFHHSDARQLIGEGEPDVLHYFAQRMKVLLLPFRIIRNRVHRDRDSARYFPPWRAETFTKIQVGVVVACQWSSCRSGAKGKITNPLTQQSTQVAMPLRRIRIVTGKKNQFNKGRYIHSWLVALWIGCKELPTCG